MSRRPAILSVRSANKIYRMGDVDVAALREASLDIYDGEFLVIVGPSGSGKSTLLNLIGGMDRPTSGQVLLHRLPAVGAPSGPPDPGRPEDLATASDARLTLYRRVQVGFVFQFFNLIPTLTAEENVQTATELAGEAMAPREALALVGMADRASHFPSQLSGGEQQRVAVARALAGSPRMLLCDEPTGAIDTDNSREVLRLLCDLNRRLRKTVVLITHDAAIRQVADRTATMHDGRIVAAEDNPHPLSVEEMAW